MAEGGTESRPGNTRTRTEKKANKEIYEEDDKEEEEEE